MKQEEPARYMDQDSYRVMGVCVWEADVMICHALRFRTKEAAAARLTCHIPYTAVSNHHPKTHQNLPPFIFGLMPLLLFREWIDTNTRQTGTCVAHMSTAAQHDRTETV